VWTCLVPGETICRRGTTARFGSFLEEAKDSPYYALFHTALFTGMRRSELLALEWRDISLHQVHVSRSLHQLRDGSYVFTQPKSAKSRRTIALSPSSVLTLMEHKEKQEAIRAVLGMRLKRRTWYSAHSKASPCGLTQSRGLGVMMARKRA
jgi:integrase